MHALVLLCVNQYTKFEVPSFINSEDMIGAKFKNGSRDCDHCVQHYGREAPRRAGLSSAAEACFGSLAIRCGDFIASQRYRLVFLQGLNRTRTGDHQAGNYK